MPPPVSVTTPHSCERDVLDGTMVNLRTVTFCRNEGATVATGVTGGSPSGSVPVSSDVGGGGEVHNRCRPPVGVGVRSTPVSSEVGVSVGSGVGVGVSVGSGVNVEVGGHYQLWALA